MELIKVRNTISRFSAFDNITAMGLNAGGDKPEESHVKACEVWIKVYLRWNDKINYSLGSSYGLKHVVEYWLKVLHTANIDLKNENGEIIENHCYVSNGAFIEAMKRQNFLHVSHPGDINPHFCAEYIGPRLKEEYSRNSYRMPKSEHDWNKIICPWLV